MLALLWELLIGLIVGALAKFVMPGKDPGGIFITMAIGIAGSIGATFLGQMIGWYRQGQSAGFIMGRAAPSIPPIVFTAITLFAVANTALVNYVTASRLIYGMVRRKLM